MKQSVLNFVEEWNKSHPKLTFVVAGAQSGNVYRATSISVRFPPAQYHHLYDVDVWRRMTVSCSQKSHHTIIAASDEDVFQDGILEFFVASQGHNYKEYYIIKVLKWLGEEFFSLPTAITTASD